MSYQSRKTRQTLHHAVEKFFLPLIFAKVYATTEEMFIASYDDIASCDNIYSGDVSAILLNAFTFGEMKLNWDVEDERRIRLYDFENIDINDRKIYNIVENVHDIWLNRMRDAHVMFDFDYRSPISFSDIADTVLGIGKWLGINNDLAAAFEGVPTDDILA